MARWSGNALPRRTPELLRLALEPLAKLRLQVLRGAEVEPGQTDLLQPRLVRLVEVAVPGCWIEPRAATEWAGATTLRVQGPVYAVQPHFSGRFVVPPWRRSPTPGDNPV